MNYLFLSNTMLFRSVKPEAIEKMLSHLGAFTKKYSKGEAVCRAGDTVENMGMVLSGSINIESDDVWGNRSILGHGEIGEIFAEAYACIPGEPMLVSVIACEKTEVLFLNTARLMTACTDVCEEHNKLIKNLLQISASKNLSLSRRILHTASKTIRGRLMSYLSEQVKIQGGHSFSIPFNRQQLADYLSVDRSAMSNELSKLQNEGIITFNKNSFTIHQS